MRLPPLAPGMVQVCEQHSSSLNPVKSDIYSDLPYRSVRMPNQVCSGIKSAAAMVTGRVMDRLLISRPVQRSSGLFSCCGALQYAEVCAVLCWWADHSWPDPPVRCSNAWSLIRHRDSNSTAPYTSRPSNQYADSSSRTCFASSCNQSHLSAKGSLQKARRHY